MKERINIPLVITTLRDIIREISTIGELADQIKRYIYYNDTEQFSQLHKNPRMQGFQILHVRTDCGHYKDEDAIRLVHAWLGFITEAGEIAQAIQGLEKGESVDTLNLIEECGDMQWYLNLMAIAISSLEDVMERNIAKLRVRFPEKFSEEDAIDRDLEEERKSIEKEEEQ